MVFGSSSNRFYMLSKRDGFLYVLVPDIHVKSCYKIPTYSETFEALKLSVRPSINQNVS